MSVWNELPEVVVEVGTIFSFKKHLDSYISKMGLDMYMGQMQEIGTSLMVKTGWHGQVGQERLFPCCKPL